MMTGSSELVCILGFYAKVNGTTLMEEVHYYYYYLNRRRCSSEANEGKNGEKVGQHSFAVLTKRKPKFEVSKAA